MKIQGLSKAFLSFHITSLHLSRFMSRSHETAVLLEFGITSWPLIYQPRYHVRVWNSAAGPQVDIMWAWLASPQHEWWSCRTSEGWYKIAGAGERTFGPVVAGDFHSALGPIHGNDTHPVRIRDSLDQATFSTVGAFGKGQGSAWALWLVCGYAALYAASCNALCFPTPIWNSQPMILELFVLQSLVEVQCLCVGGQSISIWCALTLSLVHWLSFLGGLLAGNNPCTLEKPHKSCTLGTWPSRLAISLALVELEIFLLRTHQLATCFNNYFHNLICCMIRQLV